MPRPARPPRYDEDDDRPPRRHHKSKAGGGNGPLIALVVGGAALLLLVCGGLGVVGWLVLGRDGAKPAQTNVAARPDDPVPADRRPVRADQPRPADVWQRLTPAGHPVTLLAPGVPVAADDIKLKLLGSKALSFLPPQAWQAKDSDGTVYFLLQVAKSGNADDIRWAGAKPEAELGAGYIANFAPRESHGPITADGLKGEEFGPEKGWPLNYRFVFRAVTVGNRIYVFGTNSRPDDPNVRRFFDSFKFARGAGSEPVGPAPGSPVGMPGLTAYLSFDADPAGGGTAVDVVTGRPVGTAVGKVGRSKGIRGQALDLTAGGSFQLTGLETATTAKPGRPFTVALWVKTAAANGTVFLAGTPGAKPAYPHLELGLLPRYAPRDGLQSVFIRRLPGPADKTSEERIAFQTTVAGSWTHLTFTRDAAGQAIMFVNGERRPANVREGMVGTIGGPSAALGGLSTVPKSEFGSSSDPDPKERTPFVGLIDELALFDVALSPDQIRRLAGE